MCLHALILTVISCVPSTAARRRLVVMGAAPSRVLDRLWLGAGNVVKCEPPHAFFSEQGVTHIVSLGSDEPAPGLRARLGALLQKRNVKIFEIVKAWDPANTGEVPKADFRAHVTKLGLQAEAWELDELFDSLDQDGGGTRSTRLKRWDSPFSQRRTVALTFCL